MKTRLTSIRKGPLIYMNALDSLCFRKLKINCLKNIKKSLLCCV